VVDAATPATPLPVAAVVDEVAGARWSSVEPAISVVVATHQRESFLDELVAALAAQDSAPNYDVVFVDDASSDSTWERLKALIVTGDRAMRGLRLASGVGPSVARNTGVTRARGRWVAFTDDDCLPEPGWLRALWQAADGVALVQGCTRPVEGQRPGPWARTIDIRAATTLYETCNLAVDRDAFLEHGGFPVLGLLPGPSSRGFGEDAALGFLLARSGGRSFAADAVVRHRWLPGTYADHLRGEWRVQGFPALTRVSQEARASLWHGLFLHRRTAEVDVAVVGVAVAASLRTPWPVLLVVPWVYRRIQEVHRRNMRPRSVRTAQLLLADVVRCGALVRGSIRARRAVL
jgi:glycosyltransferase involved in cell wall biosynthesis